MYTHSTRRSRAPFFFEFCVYCVEALKPISRITYYEARGVRLGWNGKCFNQCRLGDAFRLFRPPLDIDDIPLRLSYRSGSPILTQYLLVYYGSPCNVAVFPVQPRKGATSHGLLSANILAPVTVSPLSLFQPRECRWCFTAECGPSCHLIRHERPPLRRDNESVRR